MNRIASAHLSSTLLTLLFFVTLGASHGRVYAQTTFEAILSASNATGIVVSPATGAITAILDGTTLTVSGTFDDMLSDFAGGSHIHGGMAGQDGDVLLTLTPELDADLRGGTFTEAANTFTLTAEQVTALEARGLYVNIHSAVFGSGELRGQLRPVADATFRAKLAAGTETRANTSTAGGMLLAELTGTTLTVSGSFSGLGSELATSVGGGAHIHSGNAGMDGGIAVGLISEVDASGMAGVFQAEDNVFTLTTEQIASLETQGLYGNVHSMNFPGGELRGQFLAEGSLELRAVLAGSNEFPATVTTARGTVVATYMDQELVVSGGFSNLNSDFNGGAHIHTAMLGENGGITFPLATEADVDLRGGVFLAEDNSFELEAIDAAAMLGRSLYVNVHTETHPGGEIRGQLAGSAGTVFTAVLQGDHEAPSVESTGSGQVLVEMTGSTATLSGTFSNLSSDFNGGAHLHGGIAGESGGVEVGLNAEASGGLRSGIFNASDNRVNLTTEQAAALQAREIYLNVHTEGNPSGEIRGQVLPTASAQLHAALGALADAEGSAQGAVIVEVTSQDELVVTGSFSGLNADLNASGAAYLMSGDLGTDGQSEVELTVAGGAREGTFAAADNTFALDAGLTNLIVSGNTFVEIRTGETDEEELRGHVSGVVAVALEAMLGSSSSTTATGSVHAVLMGDSLFVFGNFSSLEADFDGNAQLAVGSPGEEGDMELSLTTTDDGDLRGGTFASAENRFELTADQVTAAMEGRLFVQVSTTGAEETHLRGQLLVAANLTPTEAVVTLPDPATEIGLGGALTGSFDVMWDAATDPNGNDLFYEWQLSEDAAFSTVVMSESTTDSELEIATLTAADLLLDLGYTAADGQVTFYHRVLASDGSRMSTSEEEEVLFNLGTDTATEPPSELPSEFTLRGVYPNPFNPETTIEFDLPVTADMTLEVFNLLGQRVDVQNIGPMEAGSGQTVRFQAGSLPSGVYLYRLTASSSTGQSIISGDMTLIK